MHSTQTSKININISAFRRIPVRSAKAYINQSLALPNAMHSHRVYLCLTYLWEERNIRKCTGGGKLGGDVEIVET
jgi:hypothetical protein